MTNSRSPIRPWWRIAIVLLIVWAATFGWKLSGSLPPEEQRTGLRLLTIGMLVSLLGSWLLRSLRRPRQD